MTLIVDPVSVALDSFILEHGESVVESALQKAFGRPGQLVLPRTTTLVWYSGRSSNSLRNECHSSILVARRRTS
jgi:hypothetical protein